MRNWLLVLLFFTSRSLIACDCPPSPPISKELSEKYDLLFYGIVDSVFIGEKQSPGTVYFLVKELYKGNSPERVEVLFDAFSECLMSFSKGEEWIMYLNYEKFGVLKADFCSHSRKKASAGEMDVNALAGRSAFEAEQKFWKDNLGLHEFLQENSINKMHEEMGPRNEQPNGYSKLFLLFISLVTMGIVFFVIRKKKS